MARGELWVARRDNGDVLGFVQAYRRGDGHVTIHNIVVHPGHRRRGLGRALVHAVCEDAARVGFRAVRLKCPSDLSANTFYARMEFELVGHEQGKRRPLLVWQLRLASRERAPQAGSDRPPASPVNEAVVTQQTPAGSGS